MPTDGGKRSRRAGISHSDWRLIPSTRSSPIQSPSSSSRSTSAELVARTAATRFGATPGSCARPPWRPDPAGSATTSWGAARYRRKSTPYPRQRPLHTPPRAVEVTIRIREEASSQNRPPIRRPHRSLPALDVMQPRYPLRTCGRPASLSREDLCSGIMRDYAGWSCHIDPSVYRRLRTELRVGPPSARCFSTARVPWAVLMSCAVTCTRGDACRG